MPSCYQSVSRLDNPRWCSSSPPCCDFCALLLQQPMKIILATWHFLLPVRACSNPHHPNSQHSGLCPVANQTNMQWPEVQFSIPVAHSLNTRTVSPDNRITEYSYALRKSKPTSFLKITGHTRVGRQIPQNLKQE
jgi:hypothetical protein